VEFKQADLTKDPHVARAFDAPFDFVVNCCGETRFGMSEEEYKAKCVLSAEKCSVAAKASGVQKWVEVSTAHIYKPDSKKPATEKSKIDPWTSIARYRLAAEAAVQASKVPMVTLRPAYVYGSGDCTSLLPRVTCGAAYQALGEKMKLLWDKNLKINVVNINDVCSAIWTACTSIPPGAVYNLADSTDLDQGDLTTWIGRLFGVATGFHGAIVSNMAKVALGSVAEEANDKHVPAWTRLCQEHGIANTPLSPYIDVELLKNNSLFVDGSAITKDTPFRYGVSKCTEALLRAVIQEFIDNKQFPPILK